MALRLLGLIEFQEDKLDAAARRFTELLATGKFLDDSFYYLGLIAERRGELEQALRLYAQVQGGDNAVPRAAAGEQHTCRRTAPPAAAEELLDQLLEDEPQRAPEMLAARARIYADSGDLPQAIEVLDRGAAEYPDSVDIRYAIASTYEEQGRVTRPCANSRRAQGAPGRSGGPERLGLHAGRSHRELARARTLIERAYAAAPKNAAILDSLGWVLFRQGHGERRCRILSAAYADDRGGDIAAHLGEVLWQLGRRADAEKIWSEASAGDSDNRVLKATRQRLHSAK